jgi:hypothetical protein
MFQPSRSVTHLLPLFILLVVLGIASVSGVATVEAAPDGAPSNLAAAVISPTQINLTWVDNATDETSFKLERSPNSADWTQIAVLAANTTAYSNTGLLCNTTYYYRVIASNATGNTSPSNLTSSTTAACPTDLGTGFFEPYTMFPVEGLGLFWGPRDVAIADFNGDGRSDVAISTMHGKLLVYSQSAAGTLDTPAIYDFPGTFTNAMRFGDLNADGRTDLALTVSPTSSTYGFAVFLQNASGTLNSPINYTTLGHVGDLAIGDLNSDSRIDVVAPLTETAQLQIFYQQADGSLSSTVKSVPDLGGTQIEIADFNGDGRNDLVRVNTDGYTSSVTKDVELYAQNTDGTLAAPLLYALPLTYDLPEDIDIGDVTGDGLVDLVMTYGGNRPSAWMSVYAQRAAGGFEPFTTYNAYEIPDSIAVGDINMDGLSDVVALHVGWVRLSLHLQQPDGALSAYQLYSIPYGNEYHIHGLQVADINSDCAPDVIVADPDHGLMVLYHKPTGLNCQMPLARPTRLVAAPNTNSEIDLSWNDNADGETSYIVERSLDGASWTLLATLDPDSTSYTDTAVTCYHPRYLYRVRALSAVAGLNSGYSNTALGLLNSCVPDNLMAVSTGRSTSHLTWNDNAAAETGFSIERSPAGTNGWAEVGTAVADATSFDDQSLACDTTHDYRIRAYRDGDNVYSDYSNVARVKTDLCPPPETPTDLIATATGETTISLQWVDNASTETAFYLESSPSGAENWQVIKVTGANVTTETHTGLLCDVTYDYRVRAFRSGDGQYSDYSSVASATLDDCTTPAAPSNLYTSSPSSGRIDLFWTDNSPNEHNFRVERSLDGASWQTLGTVAPNTITYPDKTVTCDVPYSYRVIAANSAGDSAPSNVVIRATLCPADNGARLFDPYTIMPPDVWAEAIVIGDFNGDGRNDAAMTTGGSLLIYLQSATGTLADPVSYAASGRSDSMDTGDLNSDGRTDIVIGFFSLNKIGVYLQNANGTLDAPVYYTTTTGPDSVKVGDLNHDGREDVVVSHWNAASIGVYLQQADGTLGSRISYAAPQAGWDEIDIGDVNNDGLLDVVKLNGQGYANPELSVYLQQANGTLAAAVSYDSGVSQNPDGLAIGDMTGDGLSDIVVTYSANAPNAKLRVFAQNASGTINAPVSYSAYDIPEPVELADVDFDGLLDVIVAHGGWQKVSVYRQSATNTLNGYLTYSVPYASHYNPQGLAVGDINGDCAPDILLGDYNNGLVILPHAPTGLNCNTPPARPTRLDAQVVSDSQIDLTWRDNATTETEYLVERISYITGWEVIATLPANSTSYSDTDVSCYEVYYSYRVRVRRADTNSYSGYSNYVNKSVPSCEPTEFTAAPAGPEAILLTWTDNASDETAYVLEYHTGESSPSGGGQGQGEAEWAPVATLGPDVTTYTDTGLTCSTYRYYRLRAYRENGDVYTYEAVTDGWTEFCEAPPAPTDLTATSTGLTTVDLAWVYGDQQGLYFEVERSAVGMDSWQPIAWSTTLEITDTSAACGTAYDYRVYAVREVDGVHSEVSNIASATTDLCPPFNPPTNLTVVKQSNNRGLLNWVDNSSDESSFIVERSPAGLAQWQVRSSRSANSTGYTDSGLVCGMAYDYRVRAYRSSLRQYSAYTNIVTVTMDACPPPNAPSNFSAALWTNTEVDLSWVDNADETELRIERKTSDTDWVEIAVVPANTSTYRDATPFCGTYNSYRIRAYRSGDGLFSSYVETMLLLPLCPPPAAPGELSIQSASPTAMTLEWADNSDETEFRIERSPGGANNWQEIGTTGAGAQSYTDSGLTCSTAYDYRVRAYRATDAQFSAYSNTLATTTQACSPASLLVNGSFEDDDDPTPLLPDGWKGSKLKLGAGDGIDCASAFDGACSFFITGNGTGKKLSQVVAVSGSSGDHYALSFATRGTGVGSSGTYIVKVKVTFNNGKSATFKKKITLTGIFDWTEYSIPINMSSSYKQITVTIQYGKSQGKVWLDDFVLVQD